MHRDIVPLSVVEVPRQDQALAGAGSDHRCGGVRIVEVDIERRSIDTDLGRDDVELQCGSNDVQ
ncbi:MAG TPA: hypothetical protein VEZ15_02405 [Acidimicrobiia bacterium]|nr:hypothetical protein [Acidimicrobiia bacterium]